MPDHQRRGINPLREARTWKDVAQAAYQKQLAPREAESVNAEVVAERNVLLSAIKQHRNATVSRLKLLAAGARQPEPSDLMLKPDRDLYEAAERLPGYKKEKIAQ